MKNIFSRGRKILTEPQGTVLSAALVIMFMVVLSQVLGVVRQRILLAFFDPSQYALFLAAFRLPDLVFEVLAVGAFSSAFIPVFTKMLKNDEREAWDIAARIVNFGVVFFLPVAVLFGIFANPLYSVIAPGFDAEQTALVANMARFLFAAQGIFIVSYVITGVLESSRRFLIPAVAPILYNLGIIFGTLFFQPIFGIYAPIMGVVIGACAHLGIQLPLAYLLGFRFSRIWGMTPGVKSVFKLAAPRVLELSILQILKTAELLFASLLSVASYTFLNLANSLQVVPITLFGVSLAKAALPSLTRDSDDIAKFKKTFLTTLYQMMFFVIPIATFFIVLRIPIVRLVYGTDIFDWNATVQTGLVLSAFALGIPVQAALTLVSRAYYALHDTRTPVKLAIFDVVLTILIQIVCVFVLHLPVWSLAMANTLAGFLQLSILYYLLSRKIHDGNLFSIVPILKSIVAASASGAVMFVLLKTFDRSAWLKRLSFINSIEPLQTLNFESFVLDTRYTWNLLILTGFTLAAGGLLYIFILFIMKSEELSTFIHIIKGRRFKMGKQEVEPITSGQSES